tara:strand:+ start:303 stop:539 length:237 start_codon:yes stop_codon:yes gene_type:complete
MEYKSKYMADYHEEQAPKQFVVVQEVTILKSFTVEADGMIDAILQITNKNYDCIIDSCDTYAEKDIGRIVSVTVNDDD